MAHEWREDPGLKGRFHPDAPDDIQVLLHDGGPRVTDKAPELVWVTITAMNGPRFRGAVLNQPRYLMTVAQGDEITFMSVAGCEHLLLVTDAYLSERSGWEITPCNKCGFAELFDPPSQLMKVVFPQVPEGSEMPAFTSICPLCGGVQIVQNKQLVAEIKAQEAQWTTPQKRWWEFWK